MRVTMDKLKIIFFLSALLLALLPDASYANCTAVIDTSFGGNISPSDTYIKVLDGNSNDPIQLNDAMFSVSKPEKLYRSIKVLAVKNDEESTSNLMDLVFFPQWPCGETRKIPIHLTSLELDNSSISEMFKDEYWNIKDVNVAALNFYKSFALASWRKLKYPKGKSQYNIISSYLALRAFNHLAQISEPSFGMGDEMRGIYLWHIELLSRVNKRGIERIWKESDSLGTGHSIKGILYRKAWRKILSLENDAVALESIQRLYRSAQEEAETDAILAAADLNFNMIVEAGNEFARKLSLNSGISDKEIGLIRSQGRLAGEYIGFVNANFDQSRHDSLKVSQRVVEGHPYLQERLRYLESSRAREVIP